MPLASGRGRGAGARVLPDGKVARGCGAASAVAVRAAERRDGTEVTEARASDGGGSAVWLLALGQTLIYAGSYYAFPALLPDLLAETG